MEKKCSKCQEIKTFDCFPNDPKYSDGKRGICKDCRLNQWIPQEDEFLTCKTCNDEKHHSLFANHGKQKPHECKKCRNKRDIDKRNLDRNAYNKKQREIYNKNKDKINETRRKTLQKRRDNDPKYRAMMALHCRLYLAVKEKKGKTLELTGCSKEELISHLESKFKDGMSWDNYGAWHIDHIRPCASFDLTDSDEQKKCFHWSNLQPLWAQDNIQKGAKNCVM